MINYVPPSFESKLIQFFMGLLGMKRAMEKKILRNGYAKEPAKLPKSIINKCNVQVAEQNGRKIWTLFKKNTESDSVILFLHGGAYYANITKMHWDFVEQLINRINAKIVVPDYPLAPESTCEETYQFIDEVYAKIISDYSPQKIILMGDSAGGGLALGFAMKIKNEAIKQPQQIILFSPWLDVSMANPEIAEIDKHDKILSLNGLKIAGKSYAGDLDVADYRVSPIYGDFTNLVRISLFIGTNDMLIADARKCKKILEDQKIKFNYFEYPKMFHDWIIVTSLNEAKDVLNKVKNLYLEPKF